MRFLEVIFVIAVCFGARAQDEQPCQSEMAEKINEMYDAFFYGVPDKNNEDKTLYANCKLQPNPKLDADEIKITGHILFKQIYPHGMLELILSIEGFPVDANQSSRAIHIHEYGDLSNGCDSAGPHYNPYSVDHPNHPGDFGNFNARGGKIQQQLRNLKPNLFGRDAVIGRSIVVHKLADDLGKGNNRASLENGNAGARLACCVIGTANKNGWEKYTEEMAKLQSQRVARRASRQQKKP